MKITRRQLKKIILEAMDPTSDQSARSVDKKKKKRVGFGVAEIRDLTPNQTYTKKYPNAADTMVRNIRRVVEPLAKSMGYTNVNRANMLDFLDYLGKDSSDIDDSSAVKLSNSMGIFMLHPECSYPYGKKGVVMWTFHLTAPYLSETDGFDTDFGELLHTEEIEIKSNESMDTVAPKIKAILEKHLPNQKKQPVSSSPNYHIQAG